MTITPQRRVVVNVPKSSDIPVSNIDVDVTNPGRRDSVLDTLPVGWEAAQQRDPLSADYQIAVGGGSPARALTDSGVTCWRRNGNGQINVPAIGDIKKWVAGDNHTCVLADDEVTCWGWSLVGQISPPPLSNPRELSMGRELSCALGDTGAFCWGRSTEGQLMPPILSNPKRTSAVSAINTERAT